MINFDVQRETQILEVLEELGLQKTHIELIKSEPMNPSANLPYHGYNHLISVGLAAYEASKYYSSTAKTIDTANLVLAGLYHDFNHSGGADTDAINVCRAVTDMVEIMKIVEPSFDKSRLNDIARLILSTEHPNPRPALDLQEKIIRDADLLQWLAPDFDVWAERFSEETGQATTRESTIKFLNKQPIHTSFARNRLYQKGLLKKEW